MEVYDSVKGLIYTGTYTIDHGPFARESLSHMLELVADQMDKEVPNDEDH